MSFLVLRRPGIVMSEYRLKAVKCSCIRGNGGRGNFEGPPLHRRMRKWTAKLSESPHQTLQNQGVFIVTEKMPTTDKTTGTAQDSCVLSCLPLAPPSPSWALTLKTVLLPWVGSCCWRSQGGRCQCPGFFCSDLSGGGGPSRMNANGSPLFPPTQNSWGRE